MLAVAAPTAFAPAVALFDVGFMGGPVNIGVPYVFLPGLTFAVPFAQSKAFLQAFNTSSLARTDKDALAIAFPAFAGGRPGSPSVGGPKIAQTSGESIVATRSYFFIDVLAAVS